MFSWQEERRLTTNLTLHYKRVMYVVEPGAAAEAACGKRVLVVESEDGAVRIEYRGNELCARAFPKDNARVSQAAVVENKVLAGALLAIQAKQRQRDLQLLQERRLTLREEDHLRKAMGDKGQQHRRQKPARAVAIPKPQLVEDPLLGRAFAWAQEFAATPPARPGKRRAARA